MSGVMNTTKDLGKKPAVASRKSSTDVNITVRSQRLRPMYFRMRRHTPLQELVDVYSKRYDVYNFRFLFDGERINPKLTALQHGMKDGDEIDAMLQVDGGSGRG